MRSLSRAASLVAINTRLASAEIGLIPAPFGRARTPDRGSRGSRRCSSHSTSRGIDVVRVDDSGSADDPYEQLIASGVPERPPSWLEHEGGADLDQLHLGHDRCTQGCRLHAPRGLPETRSSEVIVAGPHAPPARISGTLPMFPLQRLVLPVGP